MKDVDVEYRQFRFIDFILLGFINLLCGRIDNNFLLKSLGVLMVISSLLAFVIIDYAPFLKKIFDEKKKKGAD